MARRKKDDDWIWAIAQLGGLFVALGFIYPPFRQTIFAFGSFLLALLILLIVAVLGLAIYRITTRSKRAKGASENVFTSLPNASDRTQEREPQTAAEFVERLRSIDWYQFEKLVGLVYRKLGYSVSRRGGANPDGGIDLIIEKDGLRTAVQCKQWRTWNVGVKAVREFLGALTDAGIQKGVFITLCGYTGDAKQLATKHGIEIVNEMGLAAMLEGTGARFDFETQEILRDTRKLCPKCESEMVLRTARKGIGSGRKFWGCSAYPQCRFTMPAV